MADVQTPITYIVQSAAPVTISGVAHDFVNPGDRIQLIEDIPGAYQMEVWRGTDRPVTYDGFAKDPDQPIWASTGVSFLDVDWHMEIKLAEYGGGQYMYAILMPPITPLLGARAGEDPDATGGYTARGQALPPQDGHEG